MTNLVRMSALTTSIHHCSEDISQHHKARERNKRHKIGKDKVKLFLVTENRIVYIKNHKESFPPIVPGSVLDTRMIYDHVRHKPVLPGFVVLQ